MKYIVVDDETGYRVFRATEEPGKNVLVASCTSLEAQSAAYRLLSEDWRYECPTCSAKPGSPALCARCLHARDQAGPFWEGPRRPASDSA